MTIHNQPRFNAYGVYDAYTGEKVSEHSTRADAVAAKSLNHHQRVRGVPGTERSRDAHDPTGGLFGRGLLRGLFGGRR